MEADVFEPHVSATGSVLSTPRNTPRHHNGHRNGRSPPAHATTTASSDPPAPGVAAAAPRASVDDAHLRRSGSGSVSGSAQHVRGGPSLSQTLAAAFSRSPARHDSFRLGVIHTSPSLASGASPQRSVISTTSSMASSAAASSIQAALMFPGLPFLGSSVASLGAGGGEETGDEVDDEGMLDDVRRHLDRVDEVRGEGAWLHRASKF